MDKATPSIPRLAPTIEQIKRDNSGKVEITHFSGRVTSSYFIVLGRETLVFVISVINKIVSPFCGLRRTLDAQVFMTLYWIL